MNLEALKDPTTLGASGRSKGRVASKVGVGRKTTIGRLMEEAVVVAVASSNLELDCW